MLPVSGLVPIGGQAYADRWTYLPHLGILIAVVSVLEKFNFSSWVGGVVCLGTLMVSAICIQTVPAWKNTETIFRHALAVDPHNFMAHTNLGVELDRKGFFDEAAQHFEAAVRENPTYPEALNNLGTVRVRQGRWNEAAKLFERAFHINPGLTAA